jgi:hypothetical protein
MRYFPVLAYPAQNPTESQLRFAHPEVQSVAVSKLEFPQAMKLLFLPVEISKYPFRLPSAETSGLICTEHESYE